MTDEAHHIARQAAALADPELCRDIDAMTETPEREEGSNLLADLARAKALFQQRTVLAVLTEKPCGSKPDQGIPAALAQMESNDG